MGAVQIFNFNGLDIRIIEKDGQPWFVLKDVCEILGLRSPDVRQRLSDDVVSTHTVTDTLGRTNTATIINEDGLYDVILESRKPEARKFRKWVTSEVLPSIRKHGAYMTNETLEKALTSPDFLIQLATRLKEEQEKRLAAEQKLEEQKPLVGFAETCLASKDSILVRELAKVASKQGITIGQNRLYKKLREWGLIMAGSTEPYQHAIDAGYFEVVQSGKETVAGHMIFRTTRVTPKGQVYIIDRLKREYQAVGQGGR